MSLLNGVPGQIRLLNRPIMPLAVGLILVTLSLFWFQIIANYSLVPGLAGNRLGDVAGYIAGATAGVLICSWWFQSQQLFLLGLAITTGVLIAQSTSLWIVGNFSNSFEVMSSLSWAVAAALTWTLEVFGEPANPKRS